jgi:preprotein translocase subunit SecA
VISLLTTGDVDILRDAVRPATVFWYRARQGRMIGLVAGLLTALELLIAAVLALGPEGSGWVWATRDRVAIAFSAMSVIWLLYVGWAIYKFMPSRNDRVVITLRNMVRARIDPLDAKIQALRDDELRAKRTEFQERLNRGESLDDIRPEAYACVREASRRARAHRQFECQLIGGKVIEDCCVAEMRTGEGKTIVCYMANYMKVLQGLKVHMVTVNDYLVRRDAEFCRPIFDLLGMTVGFISAEMDSYGPGARVRQAAYASDITYGTNSEFGFDYLRDNMKMDVRDQVQGRLDFAVVDEVDSILIDEARTPLIISGAAQDDISNYQRADAIARSLVRRQEQANREFAARIDEIEATAPPPVKSDPKFKAGIKKFRSDPMWLSSDEAEAIGHTQYFVVELDRKSAHMTEHGAKAAQAELGIGTFYDGRNMNWPHHIDNALRAHLCYEKDKEYVIQDDTIVIVDEFTGRLMHGRQWSDGLHQAVEAKERVTIKHQTWTLASITLQNFFKNYKQLAGMTGTAMTESDEFMKIYKLEVIAIPTNKPIRRVDYNDKLYKSIDSKFDAIVEEINGYCHNGYPADPWSLFDMLTQARKLLARRSAADGGYPNAAEMIETIENALKTFDEGRGDAAGLEQAYLKLAGERVGGRPLLVGTVSVESSEKLSQFLTRRHGIEHEVLNAKNHAREAEIVKKAGQQHEQVRGRNKQLVGNVTIATNMAGRGTDIVLGPGVADIGGLHVVGTERHESRRIDNQLRGRCGRQGDPGSSRFFLSFEDDLLRLFMNEWVLRVLNRFALEEGVPIEHKSLTKGIERAQRKVEERNFGIRKNLLEYDEVPDQQRRTFYELRQRILEGRELTEYIWETIDHTVADAVDRYFDPQFPAICAAEWAGKQLGVALEHDKLDPSDRLLLIEQVRDLACNEVRGHVQRTFGEYVDPDVLPEDWDLRNLAGWIAQYGLNMTQRQLREADPTELLDTITEAALKKIAAADLSPLEQFVDRQYGRRRLAVWAHEKFGVQIPPESLENATREDAVRIIGENMRAVYRQREIEYPIAAVLNFTLHKAGRNAIAVGEQLAKWVNLKFRLGWTYEKFVGKSPQEIFALLRDLNQEYMVNGKLDLEISAAIQQHPGEKIIEWARGRFGPLVERRRIDPASPDLSAQLRQCGYDMLRYELTQLERLVLLNTFDAVWKDHMYSMDLLRSGIGLRGYAERDPKIEFKREGTRLFNELLANIRERVTDVIFRLDYGIGGDDGQAGGPPAVLPVEPSGGDAAAEPSILSKATATHADATNRGFAESKDVQAAMQPQAPGKQTIRRQTPKVGRNDPCPCGSGKKYKQCHGKGK